MSEWQPISTAPTDGRKILVTRENAFGDNPAKIVWYGGSSPKGWRHRLGKTIRYDPTHWMEIPEPPRTQ